MIEGMADCSPTSPLLPVAECVQVQSYLERDRAPYPAEIIDTIDNIQKVYPKADVADPDAYVAALGVVLQEYSRFVVVACGDPRRGIVRTARFLPRVAEVVAWCEAEAKRLRDLKARATWMLGEHERRDRERQERTAAAGRPKIAPERIDALMSQFRQEV